VFLEREAMKRRRKKKKKKLRKACLGFEWITALYLMFIEGEETKIKISRNS